MICYSSSLKREYMERIQTAKDYVSTGPGAARTAAAVLLAVGILRSQWRQTTFGGAALFFTASYLRAPKKSTPPLSSDPSDSESSVSTEECKSAPKKSTPLLSSLPVTPKGEMLKYLEKKDYSSLSDLLEREEKRGQLEQMMNEILRIIDYKTHQALVVAIPRHFNQSTLERAVDDHFFEGNIMRLFSFGMLPYFALSKNQELIRGDCYKYIIQDVTTFTKGVKKKNPLETVIAKHKIWPRDKEQAVEDLIWLESQRDYTDPKERQGDLIDLLNARGYTDLNSAQEAGYPWRAYLSYKTVLHGSRAVDPSQARDIVQLLLWMRVEAITEQQVKERVNQCCSNLTELVEFGPSALKYCNNQDRLRKEGLRLILEFPTSAGREDPIRKAAWDHEIYPPGAAKVLDAFVEKLREDERIYNEGRLGPAGIDFDNHLYIEKLFRDVAKLREDCRHFL